MRDERRIFVVEPFLFLAFGLLQLSCIGAFINRRGYAAFWLSQLHYRGALFYVLLAGLGVWACVGLGIWFKELGYNYWWRWVYFFIGLASLFGIVLLLLRVWWWEALLLLLYDTTNPLWNLIWSVAALLGAGAVLLAVLLFIKWRRQRQWYG